MFLSLRNAALIGALGGLFAACQPTIKLEKGSKAANILGTWEVLNIEKGGRTINVQEFAGETYMEFFIQKRKNTKTNKTEVKLKYRMEIGGSEKLFDYKVEGDSVKFIEVRGWNDMRITRLEKPELQLEQVMDGSYIKWNLKARPDLDEAKKAAEKNKDKEPEGPRRY